MNIPKALITIAETMCDDYCKYHEIYLSRHKDPDEAYERMQEEVCSHCPLNDLT